jgi:hypothetical protein
VDTIIEENAAATKASKKMVPKCEENPWTALGVCRGSEGGGKAGAGRQCCDGQKAPAMDAGRSLAPDKTTPAPSPAASLTPPVLALFARVLSLGTSRYGEHTPGRGYGATLESCTAAAL